MSINPFNITKAVDYSDEEIASYWVDFERGGFSEVVKPKSPMPMLILGGKGSGKTHIMRYYSYPLQKLRYDGSVIEGIERDSYLGIYMRCSGLNSSRFKGKDQGEEAWGAVFSYYLELWLSQLLVQIIKDIIQESKADYFDIEKEICLQIRNFFDLEIDSKFDDFDDVLRFLKKLQTEVDYTVNNISLTGGDMSSIKIRVTPGNLIFGIPKLLTNKIIKLRKCQFNYLLDEFENLTIEQQRYVNTLLREKEAPSTFKIGSRLYGVQTYETFSAGEENKQGSEYEVYNIDQVFRDNLKDYSKWVRKICVKKLQKSSYEVSEDPDSPNYINKFFEEFSILELNRRLLAKSDKASRAYFEELRRSLKSIKVNNIDVNVIIDNLRFDQDRLLERTNVFLFYRKWKSGEILEKASAIIAKDCEQYFSGKQENTLHEQVLDKFKNDIIDWLCRESNEPTQYVGLDNFIKMSAGIPRHLLIILKHVYRWANFNGEEPFKRNQPIKLDTQSDGLSEAAYWFLEDARIPGAAGELVQTSLQRLGYYMKEIRLSKTPPECSISSFRLNSLELNAQIKSVLKYLTDYSYLICVPERRDNNSNRQDVTYQVNGLLAPHFELAISRRGVLPIKRIESELIFLSQNGRLFDDLVKSKRMKYNPPFDQRTMDLFS